MFTRTSAIFGNRLGLTHIWLKVLSLLSFTPGFSPVITRYNEIKKPFQRFLRLAKKLRASGL